MWIFRTHVIGTPHSKCFRKVRNKYADEVARGVLPTFNEMEEWIDRKMSRVQEATFSIEVPSEIAEASQVEESMESFYDEITKGEEVKCVGSRTRKRIRCIICLQSKFTKIKLSCGHIFHRKCIDEWARWKRTCPICNDTLNICPAIGT